MYVVFDRRGWNRGFCGREYNGRFLIHERILRLCVFLICENHYPSRQASPGLELVLTIPAPTIEPNSVMMVTNASFNNLEALFIKIYILYDE